ncbi:MAG: FAD-dependent oxidoreductase [Spirochaetaceae bacterium]|nr:FAD-dependent oxidoreductase [Spirochaetaceae bacterium]
MIPRERRDVVVLGGGPAGLAAALAASESGSDVLVVEREERLGGILKQCVHDGFGLVRFGEQLAGPEYARRYIDLVEGRRVAVSLETFVHSVRREAPAAARRAAAADGDPGFFVLTCVNRDRGVFELEARALVLATGCRERTDRQVFIHGDRPAGVLTAGLAQHLVNIEGLLPGRRAVILGSGDIGLIMARRLTLEGMEVEGVYELKSEPSGLSRNLRQCLEDFGIPLHLSTTVVEVHGKRRVEAVTVAAVDQRGQVLPGTERRVACDTLVLSVGLIPENEIAESLGLSLDPATKGPRVDQAGESQAEGVFVCGNALHVNDLADYVSESGEAAGRAAAAFAARNGAPAARGRLVPVKAGPGFLYAVPQFVDRGRPGKAVLYFRSNATLREGARFAARAIGPDGAPAATLLEKRYAALRPPEMERVEIDVALVPVDAAAVSLELERKEGLRG